MNFLTVNQLYKEINGRMSVRAVRFSQQPFEKLAIAGETGSGKTSLLKMIAGLMQPDKGTVYFRGERVLGPLETLIPGHPKIAYLSQHFELRNNYRVEEELEYKNVLPQQQADDIFRICQIDHLLKRKTDQLSGGERQRIVLARFLIASPELLLLDEPFSNLDSIHKHTIKTVLKDIGDRLGISFILVSHDAEDLLSWADKILVMKDGMILQEAGPETIYRYPVNEYVAGIFGAYNILDPGILNNGSANRLFLRPGDIRLAGPEDSILKGKVLDVLFKGACYAVRVQVNQQVLEIYTGKRVCKTGEEVGISFPQDDIHQLKTP